MATEQINKTPRAEQTREKQAKRKPWQPPAMLETPKAPTGYHYRWVREAVLGQADPTNMSKRRREGYEPVRAEDHPDWELPTVADGKHAGVIGVGGLILAKIPEETVKERETYYAQMNQDQMDAVDNDLMKEQHPAMPIHRDRQTRVSFGGPKVSDEQKKG